MHWRQFTIAHYAAVVSTLAIIVSGGSLLYAKRSYDLSAAKDFRELKDRQPAVDVQMRPTGISTLSVTIGILNRAEIDIAPLDIVAERSLEAGSLYFASKEQSIDKLSSSLSLTSMGQIAPKGRSMTSATLSGVTDGQSEQFTPGLELEFTVRIRFSDEQDSISSIRIVRRILPPLADRSDPTPEQVLQAFAATKEARSEHVMMLGAIVLIVSSLALALSFYYFRSATKFYRRRDKE